MLKKMLCILVVLAAVMGVSAEAKAHSPSYGYYGAYHYPTYQYRYQYRYSPYGYSYSYGWSRTW